MASHLEELERAHRYVNKGHEIVVAQRQRVECLKAQGHDSEYAEDVLRRYEQSQAIFEDHLARLLEQRPI
jgi:hypothetical protein